jgi:hypothetical protein
MPPHFDPSGDDLDGVLLELLRVARSATRWV